MRKHLFTLRWQREGRTVKPEFEAFISFEWPDDMMPNEDLDAAEVMLSGSRDRLVGQLAKTLPNDCKEAIKALRWMDIRARYSPETEGPYLIEDPGKSFDEASILKWISECDDDELRNYHTNNTNRRRNRVISDFG